MAREVLPPGVVVRFGRKVMLNVERLDELVAAGGIAPVAGEERAA